MKNITIILLVVLSTTACNTQKLITQGTPVLNINSRPSKTPLTLINIDILA